MTTLQIELPDTTAVAARAAGLLTPQALGRLLMQALRRREAADTQFHFEALRQLDAGGRAVVRALLGGLLLKHQAMRLAVSA